MFCFWDLIFKKSIVEIKRENKKKKNIEELRTARIIGENKWL